MLLSSNIDKKSCGGMTSHTTIVCICHPSLSRGRQDGASRNTCKLWTAIKGGPLEIMVQCSRYEPHDVWLLWLNLTSQNVHKLLEASIIGEMQCWQEQCWQEQWSMQRLLTYSEAANLNNPTLHPGRQFTHGLNCWYVDSLLLWALLSEACLDYP